MMMQEGKTFNGLNNQRGYYAGQIFDEVWKTGRGWKPFYSSYDAFVIRTMSYTTARVWGYCYFYDWVNHDPRRVARPDFLALAGFLGGAVAGIITNPVDIVFTRMQADDLYPDQAKRNYRNFSHGFSECLHEGVLFRGALANGLRIGALACSMTSLYDYCKEISYWFLGPSMFNRLWSTIAVSLVGVAASLPFDTIRTRLHLMRPLPTGEYPYEGIIDTYYKIHKFEGNMDKNANLSAFYAGAQSAFLRLFLIALVSQYLLDVYHHGNFKNEYWFPSKFSYQGGLDFDIHDPWTLAFHKGVSSTVKEGARFTGASNPENNVFNYA